jgi:hypothetical protein
VLTSALFFGGESLQTATRLGKFQQLKYSTAASSTPWTITLLCRSTKKTGNNSVVYRLASRPTPRRFDLAPRLGPTNIVVKLVSNQPVHAEIQKAFLVGKTPHALRGASRPSLPD